MPKVNKTYPAFYNGITQQSSELALDNQCRDMVNCIPDLVTGLTRRPPVKYVTHNSTYASTAKVFHTYDRGEDNEEYLFIKTNNYDTPIAIYNKAGTLMTLNGITTTIKDYLNSGEFKALTVQDTSYVVNKSKVVATSTSGLSVADANYSKVAYYWLKRASGDKYNPYNYAVYLDGVIYACNPDKPGSGVTDPPTGFEDSDYAANYLAGIINASASFNCTRSGSILKIWKDGYANFTFDSWDSWGNQASEGFKGSVNKLSDLPNDWPFSNTYIEIKGNDNNNFTNYYVKWDGSSWMETMHPNELRGRLTNMPIKIARTALNTFTYSTIDFDLPKVGDIESNPDPTFIGQTIQDIFFYKNRLGFASLDNVVMSQTGDYYDFYIKTVLDVLDDDPIDIAIASTQASQIYFVKPFQNSLFIFTKDSQFQMESEGYTSPKTVSITSVSNYPMSTVVEPKVINNSLFFISTTGGRQQLREYIKDENTLSVKGIDLNITTPTLLSEDITSINVNGVLGYVILGTTTNTVYVYMFKDSGTQRVQSSWTKWTLLQGFSYLANSYEYSILDDTFIVVCKSGSNYIYHNMDLTKTDTVFKDIGISSVLYPYTSSILLPQWYPHINEIGTPKDKVLLKKVLIQGEGDFDASIYRRDYDYTYTKSHDDTSMEDLDLHISSKVDSCDITISSNTANDFNITSIVMEGLYKPTSRQIK